MGGQRDIGTGRKKEITIEKERGGRRKEKLGRHIGNCVGRG